MLKKILLSCLFALPFGTIMADELPYLSFETSGGDVKTVGVEGLKITFSDGTMTAKNNETELSLPTASLSRMYFSSTTGIAELDSNATLEASEIYNLQGIRVGTTSPTGDIEGVPTGVYVVKRNGVTRKVVVK